MNDESKLHIIHFVASMQGGAAQHILQLSNAMAARGHRIGIVATNDQPKLVESLQGKSIDFYEIDLSNPFSLKSVLAMRSFFSKTECTHHHVHGHRAAAVVRLAAMGRPKRVPFLYTVHGYHPTHYQSTLSKSFANGLERYMERRVDAFICVSDSTKTELVRSVPRIEKRCHVIPNGIPLSHISPEQKQTYREELRAKYGLQPDQFVLGTVTRLQWQKSVHRLLQAFSLIVAADPNVHLVLVGSGPEHEKLVQMAGELNIEKNLRLLGVVEDTRPIYSMLDLFVLPSLWEGMPLTVLEAWDAEIPVVVTDVSGSRDLIEDGVTGFLATNTATGIAQAVARAKNQSADYPDILKNAKQRLLEGHTVEHMVDATEKLYRSVMASKD